MGVNEGTQVPPETPHLPESSLGLKVIQAVLSAQLWLKECFGLFSVEGRENLPEKGPFLLICNHQGGESDKLLALLRDYPFRLVVGKEVNWERTDVRGQLMRVLNVLPVRESLSLLPDDEKEALMQRIPEVDREGYLKVLDKEPSPFEVRAFLNESVDFLQQGGVVGMYPEGLFLHDDSTVLRQAYPGMAMLARSYQRKTGEALTILPVAITPEKMSVGKPVQLVEGPTVSEDVLFLMKRIAELLPKVRRGVYGE